MTLRKGIWATISSHLLHALHKVRRTWICGLGWTLNCLCLFPKKKKQSVSAGISALTQVRPPPGTRGGHFSHSQSQGRQHWPRSRMDLGFICLSLLGPSEVRTLCWSPSSPHHASRFTASFPHPPTLLFTQGTFTGPFVGVKQWARPATQGGAWQATAFRTQI